MNQEPKEPNMNKTDNITLLHGDCLEILPSIADNSVDFCLTDLPTPQPKYPNKFCRTCKHRERWECGGSIIQYCGVRHSNRTFNKLLKIKVTNPACDAYEEE